MSDMTSKATVELLINGQQAQQTLNQLRQNALQLETAIAKAAATGNKSDLKRLRKELTDTKRQIREMESATQQVEHVLRNLDKATPRELNKTLQNLNRQLEYMERGSDAWKAHAEKIKKVKAELKAVNDQLRDSEGFWDRFNRKMNDWQTTLMAGTAAVTGLIMAGRSAVRAYADMDAEMANVRKFTGMTAEQVAELNEEFKKIDTRTAREDLNKLAEEAGKLGKTSQEDVLGFVRAANQINVALDELGDGATLTLSKLTNIFGDEEKLGTEKALLAVGSVINELSQNCTASAPYLANFAQRMAGVGAQARMTIPEIMGLAAVLDSQGQKVEMSSTAVSKVIMDMFKQQDQIIKATGLNAQKFKETVTRNTNEGLLMLLEQLHSLGNIDVLAPVFKDMGENGARAAQVISALAGNLEMIKYEQQEAAKAFQEATSVTEEYDVQNNTVQAGLDKARKRVTELAVELGKKLQPVMRHVISSTTLLLRFLSTLVDFIVRYKVEILSAAVAVGVYNVAVNIATIRTKAAAAAHAVWNIAIKAGNALLPIYNILVLATSVAYNKVAGNATRAAAATRLLNAAVKANPFGLLATALVAAVAGIAAWQAKMRSAREEQERLKREAMQAANEIKEVEGKIGEETSAVKRLKEAIDAENIGSNKRNALINEFNTRFRPYLSHLLTEKSTAQDLANAYAEVVRNLRAKLLLEAKEKDMKETVGTRYGWEAQRLADYDKVAREKGTAMTGAWLKAAVDEEYANGNMSYKSLQSAVFRKHIAPQQTREGYYDSVENQLDTSLSDLSAAYMRQYISTRVHEQRVNRKWEPYQKDIDAAIEAGLNVDVGGGTGTVPTTTTTTTSSSGGTDDKFKKEKDWKAREEALNRIAYATGEKDYIAYTKRMLEIEVEFNKKKLEHTDLTEDERLSIQATYYEALLKQTENNTKLTIEEEEAAYNDKLALEKQRYIDGQVSYAVYQETIEQMEIDHLRKMASLYADGSREQLQAQRQLQDKLVANQQRHQREAEAAEKKHQDELAKMKEKYFGDNPEERRVKYNADLALLTEVYNREILAAGNNAKEKLRIEEAYQKARIALMEKYNIEGAENNKNWLQQWNDDMMEFLESDFGKAVTGTLDVFSSSMSSIFQQLTTIVQAELEIQTAAINRKYDREISLAEGNNYKIKKLEKQKEKELAQAKNEANKKMFAMQVIQAVAQTATNAINAYGSAAAIPVVGFVMAPIAAAMAVAAGMLQVAAIKKQQQASEAQGYAAGGFTPDGAIDEPVGVVHAGEWVASQKLVKNPATRPLLEALDYAQRTNSIGSLSASDVSQSITAPSVLAQSAVRAQSVPQQVIVQNVPEPTPDNGLADTIRLLRDRLDEPFLTVNSVTGETGMKQAQDEYDKLIRNKTPKSRR
jgi:TP901 family phage tail tape measure protein